MGHHPMGNQWKWWRISICLWFSVLQPIRLTSCGFWGALSRGQLGLTFKLMGCGHYINIADGVEVGGITDKIVQPAHFPLFPALLFSFLEMMKPNMALIGSFSSQQAVKLYHLSFLGYPSCSSSKHTCSAIFFYILIFPSIKAMTFCISDNW